MGGGVGPGVGFGVGGGVGLGVGGGVGSESTSSTYCFQNSASPISTRASITPSEVTEIACATVKAMVLNFIVVVFDDLDVRKS